MSDLLTVSTSVRKLAMLAARHLGSIAHVNPMFKFYRCRDSFGYLLEELTLFRNSNWYQWILISSNLDKNKSTPLSPNPTSHTPPPAMLRGPLDHWRWEHCRWWHLQCPLITYDQANLIAMSRSGLKLHFPAPQMWSAVIFRVILCLRSHLAGVMCFICCRSFKLTWLIHWFMMSSTIIHVLAINVKHLYQTESLTSDLLLDDFFFLA